MAKRVCIIGGTGFVGRSIVRQALDAGHDVVVTTRHPARARHLLVQGTQIYKANICTGKGLAEAVQGCDVVINLVGLLFERGRNTFSAAHQQGAEHVIQACKDAKVTQLLHMSALFDAQSTQASAYAETKHAAEALVKQSGLDWTIFRPSLIFGAQDSFLMRFKALSSLGAVLPVIAGKTKFQPIWVEDVARAFVASIGNAQVSQSAYTLAGDKAYSFKALLELWMEALGRTRLFLPVPNLAASMLAVVSKAMPTPLLTADQLTLLQYDNIVSKGEAFPSIFGDTSSFESLLPCLATGGQAQQLQDTLDCARTRYRKQ
ncbi:MAG: complex I NDUFA9 subunit family protein [Ghiorsea sp.]